MRYRSIVAGACALLAFTTTAVAGKTPLPSKLVGTYLATLESPTELAGTWRLTLKADRTYAVYHKGLTTIQISGKVVARGTTISLVSERSAGGPGGCDNKIGTYAWTRTGRTLTLKKFREQCPGGRTYVLTAAPWVLR